MKLNKLFDSKTVVFKKSDKYGKSDCCKTKCVEDQIEFGVKIPTDFPAFNRALVTFLKTQKNQLNVDLDSFVELYKAENLCYKTALKVVVASITFCETTPFTMKTEPQKNVEVAVKCDSEHTSLIKEYEVVGNYVNMARQLQDTPSDQLYPEEFVKRFEKAATGLGVKITVLKQADLIKKKMGLLLGVNKGSEREARLLVISYNNNKKSSETLALVGKGITYDSGGMNIKTGDYMRGMKYDMSGAAIVCSTVLALAKNKVKTNVVAVAALTENLPGPHAQRPDDIQTAYNGKTVEIDNTDAEGRLVLADAISYAAKDLKATQIIDVATLTGLMSYILSTTYTGIFSTCDMAWDAFKKAACCAGEPVWRLPMHPDYLKPLESKLADLQNSTSVKGAGSSRAACFLAEFREGVPLIHCDIASTASIQDLGQGVLVRTLYERAAQQAKE
ncbi:leucyl aminopeptidase [Mycoplasmoides pneumoniae]|uniref:leucyl aminopeptidase n=1 Tax=Mycoplasmoides pneumoniae TaxID=2104 RepID=UPI0013763064|nr:leucyl aminopeptidase [Mycoplasmoides pneumoniae]QHR15316.1 leucyl aminopeptidase [Mycoplasmoides pneumoniae]